MFPNPRVSSILDCAASLLAVSALATVLALGGCATPIGADLVATRQAYAQVDSSALHSTMPSSTTAAVLQRYDLREISIRQPHLTILPLHSKAVATGARDELFALAEMSYLAGEHLRHHARLRNAADERDFYLGAAVYAWWFLFGDSQEPPPGWFDRRFRQACDLYNLGLGQAFTERKETHGEIKIEEHIRRLPVGSLHLAIDLAKSSVRLEDFEALILADRLRVRGLSRRNREPGLGTPLVGVRRLDPELGLRRCSPVTVVLRGPRSIADLDAGTGHGSLEIHAAFEVETLNIGQQKVPMERDLTAHAAYALNQKSAWNLGRANFQDPGKGVLHRLIPIDSFRRGRIPLVFVHGTFASPITWAELNNTLLADPVLRQRYQIWSFMYGSGNPLVASAADLRDALTAQVRRLDPEGIDPALHQMVVIGHSQGGLLTKLTVTQTEDRLWRVLSETPLDQLEIDETVRAELRRLFVVGPIPFIRRVVFISTPHRGSYLAGGFVRWLGKRLVSIPGEVVSKARAVVASSGETEVGKFLGTRVPTSLDGMSPKSPLLLALAEMPVSPDVTAHSIIPVKGHGDFRKGRDGLVSYQSAHVDYVASECIVRGPHSCQKLPATIEEVRRILLEHVRLLDALADASPGPVPYQTTSTE
jgi:pimeloyl-ACP methyl ester carboxylesterase